MSETFADILQRRISRRAFLAGAGTLALAAGLPRASRALAARSSAGASGLTFTEIAKSTAATHAVPPGYRADILLRWGEPLHSSLSSFDPTTLTAQEQAARFGYNNDYLAFMPLPRGSRESGHGLLCVNHEYTMPRLMFPGMRAGQEISAITAEQVAIEQEAQGGSIVEIRRNPKGGWGYVQNSRYNRRLTARTPMRLSGPAAGHARLRTTADPEGGMVKGTFANCAGGRTPWGTVLSGEENFDTYFFGTGEDTKEAENHARYGVGKKLFYGWHRFDRRFDVATEPHEPNRFGWIVEYDPYDPDSLPVKRTALGRFKHEGANTVIAADGRLVVYTGDDERFQCVYRFVSRDKVAVDPASNRDLLDHGTLYAGKFDDDGTLKWLPLVYGEGPLTSANGFDSQGEVLIEARRAAELLGATLMDRPEGIDISPANGRVYASMTNNDRRERDDTDKANPRGPNLYGHIIEMIPPEPGAHTADHFRWDVFLMGGNPREAAHHAYYPGTVSENGWLTNPDNLAFDPEGRLWIATDGQPDYAGFNDGLYAAECGGAQRGVPRAFFTAPVGAEVCGPAFTPDGTTLFLSVQHPGDAEGASFDNPPTRWPDFTETSPPRPSVLAITREDGGKIGT